MDFIGALQSVIDYNGLGKYVFNWFFLEPKVYEEINYQQIPCPDDYGMDCTIEDNPDYFQLQVLWMIAVEMFGECGTSPRFGWITQVPEFKEWVLKITEGWREDEDYDGPPEYKINTIVG